MKNFKNLLLLILPIWSFNLFATDIDNDEVFACAIDRFTLNSLAANIGNDYEDDELKNVSMLRMQLWGVTTLTYLLLYEKDIEKRMEIALKAQEERIKKLKQDYGGMEEVFLNYDMVLTELTGCYYPKLQNIFYFYLNSIDKGGEGIIWREDLQ